MIQEFFTSRNNGANGADFVGQTGRLWHDPTNNVIRVSDGTTPGGTIVGGSGGNGGATNPAGLTTQVQFNNAGLFGASSNFTFTSSNATLTVANAVVAANATFSNTVTVANTIRTVGLTANGVVNISSVSNLYIPGGNASEVLTTYGNGLLRWAAVSSGNANAANANYANYAGNAFSVSGSNVTGAVANATYATNSGVANTANAVAGANVTGTVANATYANVAGVAYSVSGSNVSGAVANATYANIAGTAYSVSGGNVTGVVANATYAVSSNIANTANAVAGANVSGQVANALIAGTVYTAAQPNITSVGTLTSLTVNGVSNLGTAANLRINGGNANQVLTSSGNGNVTWANAVGSLTPPGGSNTQVQFNNANAFGGTANFWFDSTTGILSVPQIYSELSGNVTGNTSQTSNMIDVTNEPTGFPDPERTLTTLSFNNSTRTLTISPTAATFWVWVKGTRFIKTAESIQVPNTTQLNYISYNSVGTLQTSTTFFDLANVAPVALVYWNATTAKAEYFADERHGTTMDWQTHEYLHRTRGAAYATGFVITYSDTGTGSLDADAQIGISSGTFYDEDIEIAVTTTTTPASNSFQQDLALPGKIPVFYRSGSAWVMDTATSFPFKPNSSRPTYNLNTGGTWSAADITNNNYGVMYILATNNLNSPVISLMGQAQYSSLGAAQDAHFSDLDLGTMPATEFRVLYQIIFQTSNGYTNAVKARIRSVLDLRTESVTTLTSGATSATDTTFREDPASVFATDATANSAWNTYVSGVTVANATAATTAGTVTTAAQPNITSVGTLTSLTVGGNILPNANVTYNLGSPTARFKDLYLSNNTIYMGNASISANGNAISMTTANGTSVTVTTGGSNTQVQFNDAGNFAGASTFTFDKTSNTLSIANLSVTTTSNLGAVGNVKITGGTSGQFLSTNGNGTLSWATASGGGNGSPGGSNTQVQFNNAGSFGGSANFTFDGNNVVVTGSISANTFITTGTGSPNYTSSADFVFNTGSNVGALVVYGTVQASKVLTLTPQTSAPTAATGSFAVALPPGWDPATKGGTTPYPVFYNGTTWTALY